MNTELIKIIEAGLEGDSARVGRYALQLAANLEQAGDARSARRVRRCLERGPGGAVHLDRLPTAPVDQDTRLQIADLYMPSAGDLAAVVVPDTLVPALQEFARRVVNRPILERAGISQRSSLLLHGQPGSGKTTLAHWVAHEVKLPLVIARLDSLVSSMLGGTSRNIRRLFDFAAQQPCVLFLDELDAIAKTRDDPHEMGELKRSVNSMLQNVDTFLEGGGVLLAATNHPDLLDRAVWRRFSTVIEVAYPSSDGVRMLLERYLPSTSELLPREIDRLVNAFEGLSPSDIGTVVQGSVARAVLDGKKDPTFGDVLVELHRHLHPRGNDELELVAFLHKHGASRRTIVATLGASSRQVRNHLNSV